MAYKDALQDIASFFTISYGQDSMGAQVKTEVIQYLSIPCRLHNDRAINLDTDHPSEFDRTRNRWIVMVEKQYNQGEEKGRVDINGKNYIIIKPNPIKGDKPTPHHIVYFLREQE